MHDDESVSPLIGPTVERRSRIELEQLVHVDRDWFVTLAVAFPIVACLLRESMDEKQRRKNKIQLEFFLSEFPLCHIKLIDMSDNKYQSILFLSRHINQKRKKTIYCSNPKRNVW